MVLTVAVRALEFQNGSDLWRSYLDILAESSNLSLNFVAGHPAYNIDQTVSIKMALPKFLCQVRERTDRPIFLGIDNLSSKFIKKICQLYSPVIPFALDGDIRLVNGFSKEISSPLAIYTPLAIATENPETNIDELFPYILRRKRVQQQLKTVENWNPGFSLSTWSTAPENIQKVIKSNLNEFIVTNSNLTEKISMFRAHNVKLIVGYPAISSLRNQQIQEFKIR